MFKFRKSFSRVVVTAVLAALPAVAFMPAASANAAGVPTAPIGACSRASVGRGVRAVHWSMVNMRSGPSTGHHITGHLGRGSHVRVLSYARNCNGQLWARVVAHGCIAWVIASSLA